MADDIATAYNGTLEAEINTDIQNPVKEFYRLPLKVRNEIDISVQATQNASICLFDGSKSSDASDIKVEIVLGGDKNSTVSIGLTKDDGTGKYPKELVAKEACLSATHFKVFTIRWNKGRVMVYNHGFKKPFVAWSGPPEARFSSIGVRTVGCSGDWKVQGAAKLTTADSSEYKEFVINCGRFDYEVESFRDPYVLLTPEPKWSRNPIVHVILGAWGSAKRSGIWVNFAEVTALEEADYPVVQKEYRRFWIQWDAYNIWVGHGGKEFPFLHHYSGTTPLPQMNYFALQAHNLSVYARFHVLDQVKDEERGSGSGGQTAAAAGGAGEEGILVYNYEYKQ